MTHYVIAVDIGASSGRVILGKYQNRQLQIEEVHRFANQLVTRSGQECWNIDAIYQQICTGVSKVQQRGIDADCIAIDTWGVDFVLLDEQGSRLGEAVAYRDNRTTGMAQDVFESALDKQTLYRHTGIQNLEFNSIFQLRALQHNPPVWLDKVRDLLLIPDYLNYRLSGVKQCDYTNASTTGMLDCHTRQWSKPVIEALGINPDWLGEPLAPNRIIGHYRTRLGTIAVAGVASHDTASAVAGTPLTDKFSAYLCSGTWSLMGVERQTPLNSEAALQANLTNEGGAENTIRLLKNIMGMWLIQGVQKEHSEHSFADIAALAQQSEPFAFVINPDDKRFLNPGNMSTAICDFCEQSGQGRPQSLAQICRCVYDSLALTYRDVFNELIQVTNSALNHLHVVGGGANNHFLNQLCADVCGVPVTANPTEASAIGNMLGQLIAIGAIDNLADGRAIVRDSFSLRRYTPNLISVPEHQYQLFQQLRQ